MCAYAYARVGPPTLARTRYTKAMPSDAARELPKTATAKATATAFVDAFAHADWTKLAALLAEDAGLRAWGPAGIATAHPRHAVIEHLQAARRNETLLELDRHQPLADASRVAIEYRLHVRRAHDYAEHNGAWWLHFDDKGRIIALDWYQAALAPCRRQPNWRARADCSSEELDHLLTTIHWVPTDRPVIPINIRQHAGADLNWISIGGSHPRANYIEGTYFATSEADRRIDETIAAHRVRDAGFTWRVRPFDRPPDLAQRLEAHGLLYAGEQTLMVRRGLADIEPVTADHIQIDHVAVDDDAAITDLLTVAAECFDLPDDVVDHLRLTWFIDLPETVPDDYRSHFYLARVDGEPAGFASWSARNGMVLLGGAATRQCFRRRRVYSALLAQRLGDAASDGFEVAFIHASHDAAPIVGRHGFEALAQTQIYGWMPEIDPEVIASLADG